MIAAYNLILGVPLPAVGRLLARSERRWHTVAGLACVMAATVLLLNALL